MFEAVIGLEIHAELKTASKIFCSCKNSFGASPNTQVCPVCMGLPGALPVLNKKVVDLAITAGLALNCEISKFSRMDRKNYFYPDLPKAYQISQNKFPLCTKGYIDLDNKRINIERIHIEEDAGKLFHNSDGTTLVDFNRCGVPLIEIVTYPDIRSGKEAVAFLEALKEILDYTDVSDCKMQEGSLRCDINISLRKKESNLLGTRCEIKNLNSFSAVLSAIDYEITRQSELLNAGKRVLLETRRWDDTKKITVSMRKKENSNDYRYFPEPDLLPVLITDEQIKNIKAQIPVLPKKRRNNYIKNYNLSEKEAKILTSSKALCEYFEACLKNSSDAKAISNWLLGDVSKLLNEKKMSFDKIPFSPDFLVELINLVKNDTISNTAAKKVLDKMFVAELRPNEIVKTLGLAQNSNENEIKTLVKLVLEENKKSVDDYNSGNKRAFGFLIGQAMKKSGGNINPKILNEILQKELDNQR